MNETVRLNSRLVDSLALVSADAWDACANPPGQRYNPFLSHAFLRSLEESGSATPLTGWSAVHLLVEDTTGRLYGCLPLYLKDHSRGEYVFDHSWADAYERAGGHYYPKLLAAVPFTPVAGRRLLVADGPLADQTTRQLLESAISLADDNQLSSLHINFISPEQLPLFEDTRLLVREGRQFHFENRGFNNFGDYLDGLASRKRKAVKKERRQAVESGLEIRNLTGEAIEPHHWDAFFAFYMDTGSRKWGSPYLTRALFSQIGERMANDILLTLAYDDGRPVAGALNFIGSDTLYGRYWGMSEYHPALHFELCYYQAIDYAITNGLKRVEAGAQGEHKLARGYLPTPTYSVHYLPNEGFRKAVGLFLSQEQRYIKEEHEVLNEHSPYRNDNICREESEE